MNPVRAQVLDLIDNLSCEASDEVAAEIAGEILNRTGLRNVTFHAFWDALSEENKEEMQAWIMEHEA